MVPDLEFWPNFESRSSDMLSILKFSKEFGGDRKQGPKSEGAGRFF